MCYQLCSCAPLSLWRLFSVGDIFTPLTAQRWNISFPFGCSVAESLKLELEQRYAAGRPMPIPDACAILQDIFQDFVFQLGDMAALCRIQEPGSVDLRILRDASRFWGTLRWVPRLWQDSFLLQHHPLLRPAPVRCSRFCFLDGIS